MTKKMIEYSIEAKLWFDLDDDIPITEYLEKLRETGEAEVVHVKIVEKEESYQD